MVGMRWQSVLSLFVLWVAFSVTEAAADDCEKLASVDTAAMVKQVTRLKEIVPQLNNIRNNRSNSQLTDEELLQARPLEIEACGLISQQNLVMQNILSALKSPACADSPYRKAIPTYEEMVRDDYPNAIKVACNPR